MRADDTFGNDAPVSEKTKGLLSPGTVDLKNRPRVKNPDGSISTVRSASFNFDGKEVLLPTVSDDGRILSDDDAVSQYRTTGKHLGVFDTPENASAYANQLHKDQEAMVAADTSPASWTDTAKAIKVRDMDPPKRLEAFENWQKQTGDYLFNKSGGAGFERLVGGCLNPGCQA